MRISTEIGSIARIVGEEKAVEYVAKAGFDAWDFSMFDMVKYDWSLGKGVISDHPTNSKDYLAFARKLKQIGEDLGIVCNQSHAPFPVRDKAVLDCLKRSIECTAEAGGKICIIHPDNCSSPEKNAEFYHSILPFAKECGIKIATENMWNWDSDNQVAAFAACSNPLSFLAHLNTVNDEDLVACLDIGHAEMLGLNTSATEMIYALGIHLKALHIHDTDLVHDSHQIPFSLNIDFESIAKALKDINYSGDFTLEADRYLDGRSPDDVFEGICNLANSAKRFRELFENV